MKRARWLLLLVALSAGALWLAGRAPSRYVLEEEGRRFQAQRRDTEAQLARRIDVLAAQGGDEQELIRLKRERGAARRAVRRLRMRGWDVLLIPAGAARPEPDDFLVLFSFDPSQPQDLEPLRGAMQVWVQPGGTLAALLYRLGLSP